MEFGIYQLIDASLVQQQRFDNISNNLANSNTNGFKKDILTFDQELSTVSGTATDFGPGPIIHTGNELDVALEGQGFITVQTPAGTRYTRDGAFRLNKDRNLVTQSGHIVLGKNGPITIGEGNLTIDKQGQVLSDNQLIDSLALADFDNPQLLRKEGLSLYVYTGGTEGIISVEDTSIQQRYLEKSNVGATEEMIKMIEAFRTFESIQKAIQSIDEATSKMVNDSGLLQS
ncbi:MAG: flagellar hook-basal body protein [Desulfobacterales bacterium]